MSNELTRLWLCQLKLERVQSYLFSDSELKSMIGSNALLGEVFRGRLEPAESGTQFALHVSSDSKSDDDPDNLPALAAQFSLKMPDVGLGIQDVQPKEVVGDANDSPWGAFQLGVLVRDAGKLDVLFASRVEVEDFLIAAESLVARRVPGASVRKRVVPLVQGTDGRWTAEEQSHDGSDAPEIKSAGSMPLENPMFQVCQVSGQGPASIVDNEKRFVSLAAAAKSEKARAFYGGHTTDVIGVLNRDIYDRLGMDRSDIPRGTPDFASISPSGFLATIVADGNSMGSRSRAWCDKLRAGEDLPSIEEGATFIDFQHYAVMEQFYYQMRQAVRAALLDAIEETFRPLVESGWPDHRRHLPFQLLMLGGDDLVLVCDAPFAMPFLVAYAKALDIPDRRLPDGNGPVSIGAGVAITKQKFPFHRAHQLAEQLADSAKRFYRSMPGEQSVVDWLATTESWYGELEETRQRCVDLYAVPTEDGSREERLILSRKPYCIVEPYESDDRNTAESRPTWEGQTLANLWDVAHATAASDAPRSQLKRVVSALRQGKRQADRATSDACQRLPKAVRKRLAKARVFEATGRSHVPITSWTEVGPTIFTSSYLDFLELYDLATRALTSKQHSPQRQEAPIAAGSEAQS